MPQLLALFWHTSGSLCSSQLESAGSVIVVLCGPWRYAEATLLHFNLSPSCLLVLDHPSKTSPTGRTYVLLHLILCSIHLLTLLKHICFDILDSQRYSDFVRNLNCTILVSWYICTYKSEEHLIKLDGHERSKECFVISAVSIMTKVGVKGHLQLFGRRQHLPNASKGEILREEFEIL